MPQYLENYNASIIDKVNRLETIEEPKIVLLGNSNLAFGCDSKLIEDAFGMPVVNMGLHGGLGNKFHENMAKLNVNRGYIYILCHSNYNDDGTIPDKTLAWLTIENHLDFYKILELNDMTSMIMDYPIYLKKCINLWREGEGNKQDYSSYSRSWFNEYGDVYLQRYNAYIFDENSLVVPSINDNVLDRINKLNEYITERGAILVVAAFPVGKGEYTPDVSQYIKFWNELQEKLDCPVISNIEDYMFDYEYFWDTYIHMTSDGAILRTEQLIEDLKNSGLIIN